jgi:hypothetical protein
MMADLFERIDCAERACAEALDALEVRVPLPGDGAGTVWDADRAVLALERVTAAFDALGALERAGAELEAQHHARLRGRLSDLARMHALLTMSVAREKDALRDRLLLTRTATRGFDWHQSDGSAVRCDMRG